MGKPTCQQQVLILAASPSRSPRRRGHQLTSTYIPWCHLRRCMSIGVTCPLQVFRDRLIHEGDCEYFNGLMREIIIS
jgi:hypothetical protein